MANSVTISLQGGFTDHSNNVVGMLTPAQLTAKYPSATLKTPTRSFNFHFQGHTVAFTQGRPVMCQPDLLAALTAASAPVV